MRHTESTFVGWDNTEEAPTILNQGYDAHSLYGYNGG